MGSHKLDNVVEEVLQHYGIKGMKWDVRRTPEQIKADAQNAAFQTAEAIENAGDEVMGNDSIMEELGDVLDIIFGGKGDIGKEVYEVMDATKDKLEDVSADVKKRGAVMMERMFGKSKPVNRINGKDVSSKSKSSSKEKKTITKDEAIKNPLTGKPIILKAKNGQEYGLKKPKFEAKGNFKGVDRKKMRNR